MKYNIILVTFPFDDFSGSKVRPALCLTDFIGSYYHVVVAFITTNLLRETEKSDLTVTSSHQNFSQTGLAKTSLLRLHRLASISESMIISVIGSLPDDMRPEVVNKLKSLLDV